jgi:cysteinyl-tRNA synthetase
VQVSAVVEALLGHRAEARKQKNWMVADQIRDALKAAGIRVNDSAGLSQWSIERDELDSLIYFHRVRSAFLAGDQGTLDAELNRAAAAGVHFSKSSNLDSSPAWRGKPSSEHILGVLQPLLHRLEALQ